MEDNEVQGLCFRCENRARFLEGKPGSFRMQCKDPSFNSCSCYQYCPVKPVVLHKDESEKVLKIKRPMFGGILLSARSHPVCIPKLQLNLKKYKNGSMIYWGPKENKSN